VECGEERGAREQCVGSQRHWDARCVRGGCGIDGDFEGDAEDVPFAAVFGDGVGYAGGGWGEESECGGQEGMCEDDIAMEECAGGARVERAEGS
jgi:hypothetical protein